MSENMMSKEVMEVITKEEKTMKLFKKPENEFFKVTELRKWSFANFLSYRLVQTSLVFTNNERYESSYYSSFIDFYKNIDTELANILKADFKDHKESSFTKGWWQGVKIDDQKSLINFSKGLNFGSHQVFVKDKNSENLSSNQYKRIKWILKSGRDVFTVFKDFLLSKKTYTIWIEICKEDTPSHLSDEYIVFDDKISSHIIKLFKWMDDSQSDILTLPLPLSLEVNSLTIEANIYSFILQSMEKNFWRHNKDFLKEISEAQFTSSALYEILNHILYCLNRKLKVQL
ncbi:hypothetical protein RhiirA4_482432 [Rhizophagus irregularis]|uniref:Uncharacterized protein n=1 Tax=Rhizophagus irregularis TaxID=588596 RepID=A0A2I1HL71_9GLOM|nr:hypothetical protein RhiirA4_482432 [Rhizophagus irregularis]